MRLQTERLAVWVLVVVGEEAFDDAVDGGLGSQCKDGAESLNCCGILGVGVHWMN